MTAVAAPACPSEAATCPAGPGSSTAIRSGNTARQRASLESSGPHGPHGCSGDKVHQPCTDVTLTCPAVNINAGGLRAAANALIACRWSRQAADGPGKCLHLLLGRACDYCARPRGRGKPGSYHQRPHGTGSAAAACAVGHVQRIMIVQDAVNHRQYGRGPVHETASKARHPLAPVSGHRSQPDGHHVVRDGDHHDVRGRHAPDHARAASGTAACTRFDAGSHATRPGGRGRGLGRGSGRRLPGLRHGPPCVSLPRRRHHDGVCGYR